MSDFRFRLFSVEWDELGEYETVVPNWTHGDEFVTGDGLEFRILDIVPIRDNVGSYHGFWKVELVAE